MNNQLLLMIQREIFNYTSTFINDDIIPPPYELLRLGDVARQAYQLLEKIEKGDQKPSPGRLGLIIRELVAFEKGKLVPNPRFIEMLSSLITKLNGYYYLATSSLRISV